MADKRKLPWLLAAFAICAALVAWDRWPHQSVQVSDATPRPQGTAAATAPTAAKSNAPAVTEVAALHPRDDFGLPGQQANLFAQAVPPAPPPVVMAVQSVQVAAPTAPPLPFTVIGRKFEQGQWEIYLSKGDDTYIAHLDDVIEETYKVAAIKPPAMTLVHLPTNERQTLQIGAPSHD